MRLQSLRSKLLVAVSALVIGSGLLISLLVTQRYSSSLMEAAQAQAENLAHAVALEAADKILTNDLVALQKIFDYQVRSNPAISYLFVLREDRILGHTFTNGVPADLLNANDIASGNEAHFQRIISTDGEHYLDIAWPIFKGKAGVLRFGFSEKPYRGEMNRLWLQMSALTLGILLLALGGSLLFVRRITRPLAFLAQATRMIDKGELGVKVEVQGHDEVAVLASSFNDMVARVEKNTRQLEEQTKELERAHNQTQTFCAIIQEVGAQRNLNEIGSFLINRFQTTLKCEQMALLLANDSQNLLFMLSRDGVRTLNEPATIQTAVTVLERLKKVTFTKGSIFRPPLVPDEFQPPVRQAIVPLHYENQPFGALIIGCRDGCRCHAQDVNAVGMILSQAAGAIKRAMLQEEEIRDLQTRLETSAEFSGIVGKDPSIRRQ